MTPSSNIEVAADDIASTLPCKSVCHTWPEWTLETTKHHLITINTTRANNDSWHVEINDGFESGEASLRIYDETGLRDHYFSASTTVRITINASCTIRMFDVNMTFAAESFPGM